MALSSAELEREATAARERLATTLDQLRENLAPGRLVDEVLEHVGATGGTSLFRRVESGIRSYPLPSMLVGIGSALFMGSNWTKKPPRAASSSADQASLHLGDFDSKSMRDNVASVGHSITDTAYHTLKLRAAEKLEKVTRAATAGMGAASDHVIGVAEQAIDRVVGKVSAKVEERPLAFSVIAIAVGAAVGAALLRTTNGKVS